MLTRAWFLLLAVAVFAVPLRGDVYLTEDQALKLAFPSADSVEKQLLALTGEERATLEKKLGSKDAPRIFKYWVGKRQGVTVGYAVIDEVLGKDQPITYMLSVDERLTIRSVEILAYRESRGGEVRQADWRAQFKDKNAASPIRIGSDIRNIAGATISCRSLTDGIRREVICLSVLVKPAASTEGRVEPRASALARGIDNRSGVSPSRRSETVPAAASSSSRAGLLDRSQFLMGTMFEIRACTGDRDAGMAALESALAEVARLEAILSTWQEASEVSRLNRSAGKGWQPASPELLDLCARSIATSECTSGAFDVSAGPLIELWKTAARMGTVPTADEIERARRCTGFARIQIDRSRASVQLADAGMALDFGAIGKGFALDRAAAKLEEHGIHSALLDFGGQLLALDPPPGETAWTVEIRDPAQPERTSTRIRLTRASISSSGDYERGMRLGTRLISHIVDPRTGQPVAGMLGTTVISSSATDADALSTALYVLGFDAALRYAEEKGLRALIVAPGGRSARTKGFQALELVDPESR